MERHLIYRTAKNELLSASKDIKARYGRDKPMVRMCINDTADHLCKYWELSEYHRNLLANYACKLHPKN